MTQSVPLCLPDKKGKKIIALIGSIMLIIPLITFGIGWYKGETDMRIDVNSLSPTLDGKITENEWRNAYTIIPQYLDVDNMNGNPDDFNYLYLGQNTTDVFIGVDIVSNTAESNADWIAVFLNTNTSHRFDNMNEWLGSNFTYGMFYNLKSNETFANPNEFMWDIDGKEGEYELPITYDNIKLNYGQLVDMNEYKYYNLTSDWNGGVAKYQDGDAVMIYADHVNYSEAAASGIPIQIISNFIGGANPNPTLAYMEFDVDVDIYSIFPYIDPSDVNTILNQSKVTFNIGVIPMLTYNYSQRDSIPLSEREKQMQDVYSASGFIFMANLHNPQIDDVKVTGNYSEEDIERIYNSTSLQVPIISPIDALVGHDNLLEDGVLKKEIKSGYITYYTYAFLSNLIGYSSSISIKLNLEKTIEENNGHLHFTFYGLDIFEDLLYDLNITMGYAIDYFVMKMRTKDYFDVDPYGFTNIYNATVRSSFDTSPNSNTLHRIVEIAIPKSDLKTYNGKDLQIMVFGSFDNVIFNASYPMGLEPKSPIDLNIGYIFGAVVNGVSPKEAIFNSDLYYPITIDNGKRIGGMVK